MSVGTTQIESRWIRLSVPVGVTELPWVGEVHCSFHIIAVKARPVPGSSLGYLWVRTDASYVRLGDVKEISDLLNVGQSWVKIGWRPSGTLIRFHGRPTWCLPVPYEGEPARPLNQSAHAFVKERRKNG